MHLLKVPAVLEKALVSRYRKTSDADSAEVTLLMFKGKPLHGVSKVGSLSLPVPFMAAMQGYRYGMQCTAVRPSSWQRSKPPRHVLAGQQWQEILDVQMLSLLPRAQAKL